MIVRYLLIYGLVFWIMYYVADMPSLNTPKLRMPEISDLHESCTEKEIQRYIDEVILPSRDYFNLSKEIEEMCADHNKFGGILFLPVAPALLVIDEVVNYEINILIKILLCVIFVVGIPVALYFIYYARWNTLRKKKYIESDLLCDICREIKYQGYQHPDWRFSCSRNTDWSFARNFSKIIHHYNYLVGIKQKIRSRTFWGKLATNVGYVSLVAIPTILSRG